MVGIDVVYKALGSRSNIVIILNKIRGVTNSTTTWVDAIDAIKAAHPKP